MDEPSVISIILYGLIVILILILAFTLGRISIKSEYQDAKDNCKGRIEVMVKPEKTDLQFVCYPE